MFIIQMEHLSGRKTKGKSSAYAAMIRQLLEQVQKLTHQNEQLKKELATTKQASALSYETINQITSERDSSVDILKKEQDKFAAQRIHLTLQLANKEAEIGRLQSDKINLAEEIAALKREKSALKETHHSEATVAKKEMNSIRARLQELQEERNNLRKQIQDKDALHQQEVQQLRKINAIIKRNFHLIEEDYDSLLKLTSETTPIQLQHTQPPPHRKGKKEGVSVRKMRAHSNPEMEEELFRIKQQVCEQMERMSCSREKAVKGRVDRTLATIESLLGQMSQRADPSSEDD